MDTNKKSSRPSLTIEGDPRCLLEYAERHAKDADKWFRFMWAQYLWLTGFGWILSMLVPFGLALIFYLPSEAARNLVNVFLIAVSAGGLCCQILASVLRLRERSLANKQIRNRLERAINQFSTKQISIEQLQQRIDVAMKIDEDEVSP